jgi:hypothetical protein
VNGREYLRAILALVLAGWFKEGEVLLVWLRN